MNKTNQMNQLDGLGLPSPERARIKMDEFPARVKPNPTVPQRQCGMTDLAKFDARNIEVERLSLDM